MSALDYNRIKHIITNFFGREMVGEFVVFPSSVNTLLQFEIDDEKYMIKILTTPTLSEWENYRLEKEGKLLDYFTSHESLQVPVPKLIHIENDDALIGYRFIIYRFVEGTVLWHIWRDLSQQDRLHLMKELGKIVRGIHSVNYDWFGELEDIENVSKHSTYKESMLAWIQELGECISEQKSLPKELVERAQKFVHDNIDKITYTPKPTLVHNDIHQANLIVEKNDQGIYTIQALVDWEWVCSTIALDDVFYIKDTVLENKELERAFFLEYFQSERDNVDDFVLEYRIYRIGLALDTAAEVWVTHPPTDAEIKEVRTSLEEQVNSV